MVHLFDDAKAIGVMSKTSGNLGDNISIGPDLFGLYKSEVAELLAQEADFVPFSHQSSHLAGNLTGLGRENFTTKRSCSTKENNSYSRPLSLYSNGVGARLSDFGKERLKLLLRQSVFTLSQEVDEVVNPVISLCRVRSCLRYKDNLLLSSNGLSQLVGQWQHPCKKVKVLPSSSGEELSGGIAKKCTQCHETGTQLRNGPDGIEFLCNACGLGHTRGVKRGLSMCCDDEADKENGEIDDDIRFLLENDSTKVEELMNTHSNELFDMLQHMEQTLEELLNISMTTCRPMTVNEKQQLRKLIKDLPSKNVDRVLEILRHSKPSRKDSCDEVYIDLDDEDQITLWRLYFYVAAIEKAKTL